MYVISTERFEKRFLRRELIEKIAIAAFIRHLQRHACGYKQANDGQDTRAVQHYLGHKNIQHTVRYTELSPERFKSFWED